MSLDPALIRMRLTGATTGVAQVLLNYARVSRGPWRLKAFLDSEGHAVTSRFLTIRPKVGECPLEFIWALCNSPFANAYVYAQTMKRDILAGSVRAMPVPTISVDAADRVAEMARQYLAALSQSAGILAPATELDRARQLLLRLDAEVLRLYELPPRLERQLLDLFARWERPGVPFSFDRYYPDDYEPCLPLHVYLSAEYRRSTAADLLARNKTMPPAEFLTALDKAVENLEEE
jgi:hypothetical protein